MAYSAKISPEWKKWVNENLQRNVPRLMIYETMRKNGFGLGVIKDGLGNNFPEAPVIDPEGRDVTGRTVRYEDIANCRLTKDKMPGLRRVLTNKAQIYFWQDFLSPSECDKLISLINTRLVDSTISAEDGYDGFRTSKTCPFKDVDDPAVAELDAKLSKALGVSDSWSEPNQGQKYAIGQEFKAHTDYFEPGTDEYKRFCAEIGQRTWTFMIYLNEGCEGGGTRFRKLEKNFSPQRGCAVIWNSLTPEGDPNPFTLHHGQKVRAGEKYVITKWYRDKGEGQLLQD